MEYLKGIVCGLDLNFCREIILLLAKSAVLFIICFDIKIKTLIF